MKKSYLIALFVGFSLLISCSKNDPAANAPVEDDDSQSLVSQFLFAESLIGADSASVSKTLSTNGYSLNSNWYKGEASFSLAENDAQCLLRLNKNGQIYYVCLFLNNDSYTYLYANSAFLGLFKYLGASYTLKSGDIYNYYWITDGSVNMHEFSKNGPMDYNDLIGDFDSLVSDNADFTVWYLGELANWESGYNMIVSRQTNYPSFHNLNTTCISIGAKSLN